MGNFFTIAISPVELAVELLSVMPSKTFKENYFQLWYRLIAMHIQKDNALT